MFQEYLMKEYSIKVAKGYIKDYSDFESYLMQTNKNVEETTETDVKEYIQWLRDKGFSNKTIPKKISLLRKYYKWLRREGKMIHNPMDDIQQPKIVEEKREVTEEERKHLREIVEQKNSIRDKVIFKLLMDEGIKPNEMIQITFKDCDLEKRMILFDKKKVAINEETAAFIEEMKSKKSEGFLLTNQHGHPLKESGIYFVIKNYLSAMENINIKPMDLMTKKYTQ
ncbi:site-specific integrase [Bacillus mexicanus]|uniref:tyrosine-type recombinase/integrase n=1 Tax=Bacillus mexicanus TaxID=2834415 RepID=UPI003D1D7124